MRQAFFWVSRSRPHPAVPGVPQATGCCRIGREDGGAENTPAPSTRAATPMATLPTDTPPLADASVTRLEIRQGAAWITLNRPDSRNALSAALVNELDAHLAAAAANPAVRCVVITGAGSAFCAGADLNSPPGQVVSGRQGITLADLLARIQDHPKPVFRRNDKHLGIRNFDRRIIKIRMNRDAEIRR